MVADLFNGGLQVDASAKSALLHPPDLRPVIPVRRHILDQLPDDARVWRTSRHDRHDLVGRRLHVLVRGGQRTAW